jgi:dTDP-glucose pyrophosphorylase
MPDVRDRYAGSVVALMEVDPAQIHLYGCAAVEPTGEDDVVRVTGLVEKPSREHAPSAYAVIGRYVLAPAVFDVLERTPPGRGGEIQLTDALQELTAGGSVHGVVFDGLRYDTGDKADYLRTVVRLACARPDLGPGFVSWLKEFVAGLEDDGRQRETGRRAAQSMITVSSGACGQGSSSSRGTTPIRGRTTRTGNPATSSPTRISDSTPRPPRPGPRRPLPGPAVAAVAGAAPG